MGRIREEIELTGTSKCKKILALFDTGAAQNYIRRELTDGDNVENIGYHIFLGEHRAILANGDIALGEKVRFKAVNIKEHKVIEPEFIIMDNLTEDSIIGVNLMQRLRVTLDLSNEEIDTKFKHNEGSNEKRNVE